MATLQVATAPQGASKTEVTLTSSADTATLATALGANAVMIVFDPAKLLDEYTLNKLERLINQKIAESMVWPPT